MRKEIILLLIIGLIFPEIEGQKNRIWTISVNFGWGNLQYKNEKGFIVGVVIDLYSLVCQEVGMDCRIVNTPIDYCWQSNPGDLQTGGIGLLARYIDACGAFIHTIERSRVFQFGIPYLGGYDGFLYTHKDRDLDPNKLQGKKIGFLQGSLVSEQCLSRNAKGFVVKPAFMKFYPREGVSNAITALRNGELDGFFNLANLWTPDEEKELKIVSDAISCYIGGTSVMARKDSAFVANWNVGFNKFRNTNKFEKFCKDANERHIGHGGKADCLT